MIFWAIILLINAVSVAGTNPFAAVSLAIIGALVGMHNCSEER